MTSCEEALVLQREMAQCLRDNQILLQNLNVLFGAKLETLGLEVVR